MNKSLETPTPCASDRPSRPPAVAGVARPAFSVVTCESSSPQGVVVSKLIPGGQALGTLPDGKKILLWNALPGETVTELRITKNKSHFAEGIALQIANPSPERIEPRDACYLATSPWQIMSYDYELQQKAEILREIFRQHQVELPANIDFAPKTGGRDFHYRNKMEYSLYYDHDAARIFLAFHARGSHAKVPVMQSSIERPEIWAKACEIVDDLNARGEDARKYQSLLLRANQNGEVSGGLYENHQPRAKFHNLTDEILGQKYSYSPNGFFQINLPVYEMALQEIAAQVASENILDLYAGVGTIGLSVAADKDLTLVECDKSAFAEMEKNCVGKNARPVLAKSEEALDFIMQDQTVIVDPPRAGCDAKLLEKFLEVGPRQIIYLSCNPATQARDVKILSEKYQIVHLRAFNFFPRTPHLENLIVLKRK